jgi:exosortase/archaeosortase family protein
MTMPQATHRGSFGRRLALFVAVFAVLQLSWQGARGTRLEQVVVHDLTVVPAVAVVNWITPRVDARALGFSLRAPGGGLNILNGCEGLEALFLLVAALSVAPLPWRSRLLGLILGAPFVFVLNQVRIVTLFYAALSSHTLFDSLHSIVTPIAVILAVAVYFYAWLAHSTRLSAAA